MIRFVQRLIERLKADAKQFDRQARCDHAGVEDERDMVCPKCGLDCDVHLSW